MENFNPHHLRRRVDRIVLPIPVRIEAKESKEAAWSEITRFQTVSACGAGFALSRQVKAGQLLLITTPLPQKLRHYDFSEQQYKIWGIARYCMPIHDNPNLYQIGVAFVGKYPPLSYHENPFKLYDITGFSKQGFPEICEAHEDIPPLVKYPDPRYLIPFEIVLEVLDEHNNVIARQTAISENVSVSGASVFANLDVKADDVMRVSFKLFNISILARVRNRRIGNDGATRLHLQFIDRQLPLDGMS